MKYQAQFFDAEGMRQSCSSMRVDELLAIVSVDASTYQDEALEIARDELRARHLDGPQLEESVRFLKARFYDQRKSESAPGRTRLPRWMFWVCVMESAVISLLILTHLAETERSRAIRDATQAIGLGWVLKIVLWGLWSLLGGNV